MLFLMKILESGTEKMTEETLFEISLEKKPLSLLDNFADNYSKIFPQFNKEIIKEFIKKERNQNSNYLKNLQKEWYKKNCKDFSGYDDDWYFAEVWICFIEYSRRYLKDMIKPNSIGVYQTHSFLEISDDIKSVLDLGCGIGFTTAILSNMYPKAKITATNLKDTKQWKFCKHIEGQYNFKLIDDLKKIETNQDLIFASEYFEHIERPIEHLKEVLNLNPKFLVLANAFNTKAHGHFEKYKHNETEIDQKDISKIFNNCLKENNYIKIKTKYWNNRPNIWVKEALIGKDND